MVSESRGGGALGVRVQLAISAEAQTSSGREFQPRLPARGLTFVQTLRLIQLDDNPLINLMILVLDC